MNSIILGLFLVIGFIQANDNNNDAPLNNGYNTVAGVVITPENLFEVTKDVPEALQSLIESSFGHDADFVDAVVVQPGSMVEAAQRKVKQRIIDALAKKGYQNVSMSNIVFKLPSSDNNAINNDLLIKISGWANRRENKNAVYIDWHTGYLSWVNSKDIHGNTLTPPQINALAYYKDGTTIKTYQTASRMFYYLRAKEFIEKYIPHEKIKIPTMYLVHLGIRPSTIEDENCVIVEEHIHNLIPVTSADQVSPRQAVALWLLIKYAGLWHVAGNMAQDKDGNIYLYDFEQPNTTKPHQIFNYDLARWAHNTNYAEGGDTGKDELWSLFPEGSPQRKAILAAKAVHLLDNPEKIASYLETIQ